jgi:hypothetical protein
MQTTPALPARTGTFLAIATIMFLVSWVLPVTGNGEAGTGYHAYKATYRILFELGQFENVLTGDIADPFLTVILALSPHTNYIIIIAILWLAFGRRSMGTAIRKILLVFLWISLFINLTWLYALREIIEGIQIGYYLWVASFLLMTIAYASFKNYRKLEPNEPIPPNNFG